MDSDEQNSPEYKYPFYYLGVVIDPETGRRIPQYELVVETSHIKEPVSPKKDTLSDPFDPMTDAVVARRLQQAVREQAQKKLDSQLQQIQRWQSLGNRLLQSATQTASRNLPAALPYLAPITAAIPGANVLTNVLNAQRTLEMADQAFPAFGRGRRYVQGLVQGALDRVSGAPVNFTQGAVAHGMDRYEAALERGEVQPSESALWNAVQMAPYLVGDVAGNVRAGASAAWNNSGAKQIGDRVPELAENTWAGMAYNTLPRMASDPLNFIGAGNTVLATPRLLIPAVTRVAGKQAGARAVALSRLAHLAQEAPVLSSLPRSVGRVSRATSVARALEAAESAERGRRGRRGNGPYRAVFVSPQQRAGAVQARGYGDPVFYPAGQRPGKAANMSRTGASLSLPDNSRHGSFSMGSSATGGGTQGSIPISVKLGAERANAGAVPSPAPEGAPAFELDGELAIALSTAAPERWASILSEIIGEERSATTTAIQSSGMSEPEDLFSWDWGGYRWWFDDHRPDSPLVRTVLATAGAEMPDRLAQATSEVIFTRQANKDDAFWEVEYNMPGFVSAGTGGVNRQVHAYNGNALHRSTMAHELAHNLATELYGTFVPPKNSAYGLAMQAADERPPTWYAGRKPEEDFAECVMLYVDDPEYLRLHCPRRYRVIDRIMTDKNFGG